MRSFLGKLAETREFIVKNKKAPISIFGGKDKFTTTGVLLSFLLLLLQSLFLLLVYRSLPRELPFFYSRPIGQEQLGPRYALWFLPVLNLFFFLLNMFIAKKIALFITLGRILIFTSVSISILFLVTQFKIITS